MNGTGKMQRAHFKKIAEVLLVQQPHYTGPEMIRWREIVLAFAAMCATTNPAFNKQRFLDACGFES